MSNVESLNNARPYAEPFDLTTANVAYMLEQEPPARPWLIQDRLPLGVVGLLAAAGKTGKSMAVLQLAVSITSGKPWLGLPVGEQGSVLIISAEDDHSEVWRRLRVVRDQMAADDEWDELVGEKVAERLHVVDRVGEQNLLTDKIDGEIIRTTFADRVIATADELPATRLIVLDPLQRFDGGEPNDNAHGTRLIEAAEIIRKATGATVLLPHHTRKPAANDDDGDGQDVVRGASGLVDGARWIGLMQKMTSKDAKRYGVSPDAAAFYVKFTTPAANYCEPWAGMWLERQSGGVLCPVVLQEKDQVRQQRSEENYAQIVRETKTLLRRHGPLSARTIRLHYGGKEGVLGAADKAIRAALARAVEEGELIERQRQDNRGKELDFLPTVSETAQFEG